MGDEDGAIVVDYDAFVPREPPTWVGDRRRLVGHFAPRRLTLPHAHWLHRPESLCEPANHVMAVAADTRRRLGGPGGSPVRLFVLTEGELRWPGGQRG